MMNADDAHDDNDKGGMDPVLSPYGIPYGRQSEVVRLWYVTRKRGVVMREGLML